MLLDCDLDRVRLASSGTSRHRDEETGRRWRGRRDLVADGNSYSQPRHRSEGARL